jgi:hypothetical protein
MIWWILGGLAAAFCSVIFLLIIYDRFFYKNHTLIHVRNTGDHLLAWIVPIAMADVGHSYFVMLIFTFDKTIEGLPKFLSDVARRMMTLNPSHSSPNELEVVRWLQEFGNSWKMISTREELPKTLTDGRSVWFQKGYAKKELLPGGKLTRPYIYIAALQDVPKYIPMVEYPAMSDAVFSPVPAPLASPR